MIRTILALVVHSLFVVQAVPDNLIYLWNSNPNAPAPCFTHGMSHMYYGSQRIEISRSENISGPVQWADVIYSGAEPYPVKLTTAKRGLAPAGWHMCRPTTYMEPGNTYDGYVFAVSLWWFFYCLVQPQDVRYLAEFARPNFNLNGLVMYITLSPGIYGGIATEKHKPNPIPDLPFILVSPYSTQWKRDYETEAIRQISIGGLYNPWPEQTCEFYGKGKFKSGLLPNNPWAAGPTKMPVTYGPMGWVMDNSGNPNITQQLFAQLASTQSPCRQQMTSAPSRAAFVIWACLAWATVLFSSWVACLMRRKIISPIGLVVLLEGFFSSGIRAVRAMQEPVFMGNLSKYAWHNWLSFADVPWGLAATWVTLLIWGKLVLNVVLNLRMSKGVEMAYDTLMLLGAVSCIVAVNWAITLYPRRPWEPWLLAKDSDPMRTELAMAYLYCQFSFAGGFVVVCLVALMKVVSTAVSSGNQELTALMFTMLKWVSLQLVGMGFYLTAYSIHTQDMKHYDYMHPHACLYELHGQYAGAILMSFSQVMAVFSMFPRAKRVSSTSSSSSSGATVLHFSSTSSKT